MSGLFERFRDALFVTVTAYFAIAFVLAVLGAIRWTVRRVAGSVFTARSSAPPINPT